MVFSIDRFSNYFCLVFSAPLTVPHELDLGRSQLGVEPETLSEVISNLHTVSWKEFHPAIEQLMDDKESNARSFMEKVLAKCMIISGVNPTFAHFMLVCTFINGIIYDSFEYSDCFIVPKLCSCVLEFVYHRRYKYFDSIKECGALDSHMRYLKKHLAMQKVDDKKDKREIPILGEIYASSILEDLDKVGSIPLEDSEQGLFINMHSITPVDICEQPFRHLSRIVLSQSESSTEDAPENEDMPEDALESRSKPLESESLSCLDIGTEETMECVPMYEESTSKPTESELLSYLDVGAEETIVNRSCNKEDENKFNILKRDYSYFKNRICTLCDGECAKFMVSYVENILKVREVI